MKVGAGTWIGAGTTVIPGIEIGSWSTIGAGSTVINNINSNMVAVGCPCKIIRNDMKINGFAEWVRNPFLLSCITIKTIDYAA
jgi:acetyltransferase-like isoleucine patch superfamily enzyme